MRKWSIAVIGLFALIYIVPLGARPVANPDEARYAEIPREMIVSGNWVVPHLNGLRYFEKPVLGYWFTAISVALFGENGFGIRLPSAISAGITGLMLFLLVRKYGGGYPGGVFAAAAFLTSLFVFAIATINILDTGLSMFLTGAMVFFFFGYSETKAGKKTLFLALFGIFCGLAFLVKGFLAFAMPAVTIVPFLIWEHRFKDLFRLPWLPIVAAILVVLPWAVMIHQRDGDYWNYFFWTEHINRFTSPIGGQHPEPFWYFIPILIGGALPWTALLPAAISGLKKRGLREPITRFAICWFLFPFLFFSASSGKLATYILPCFPPLAILTAIGLLNYLREGRQKTFTIGAASFGVLVGILGMGLIVGETLDLSALKPYGEGESWKWIVAVVGLLTWSLFSILATRAQGNLKKIALYCAAPLLFMLGSQFIMPEKIMEGRTPGRLLTRNAHRVSPETTLVSGDQVVSAVCWFYKRDDVYLFETGGELTYGLKYDNPAPSRLLTVDQFRDLAGRNSDKNRIALIMDSTRYAKYKAIFPKPAFRDEDNGFVFIQY